MSIEGFLKGSSLVVCAPTSSGKTLVAEAAAAATIARGKRLFYTTPLQALSNQKLRDFWYIICCTLVFKVHVCCCSMNRHVYKSKKKSFNSSTWGFGSHCVWDCRELFGEENVGLITGDAAMNREAPVLIMTTEILRNMLYQRCVFKRNFSQGLRIKGLGFGDH